MGRCCRPSCVICCFDVFKNDSKIPQVECPVFIIHGECDEIVPFHNAQRLHKRTRASARWPAYFVPEAGHNDILELDARTYYERLGAFVANIRERVANPEAVSRPPNGT